MERRRPAAATLRAWVGVAAILVGLYAAAAIAFTAVSMDQYGRVDGPRALHVTLAPDLSWGLEVVSRTPDPLRFARALDARVYDDGYLVQSTGDEWARTYVRWLNERDRTHTFNFVYAFHSEAGEIIHAAETTREQGTRRTFTLLTLSVALPTLLALLAALVRAPRLSRVTFRAAGAGSITVAAACLAPMVHAGSLVAALGAVVGVCAAGAIAPRHGAVRAVICVLGSVLAVSAWTLWNVTPYALHLAWPTAVACATAFVAERCAKDAEDDVAVS